MAVPPGMGEDVGWLVVGWGGGVPDDKAIVEGVGHVDGGVGYEQAVGGIEGLGLVVADGVNDGWGLAVFWQGGVEDEQSFVAEVGEV